VYQFEFLGWKNQGKNLSRLNRFWRNLFQQFSSLWIIAAVSVYLPLSFSSPLMAGRAKVGLYRLLRQYSIRNFKISQPDHYALILQPTTGPR